MLNGPKHAWWCVRKWCNDIGLTLTNEFGFAISHTLAGKLGFWRLTGQLTPLNHLYFFRPCLGHQATIQASVLSSTPGLSTLWETWPLWYLVLWLLLLCVCWEWLNIDHVIWSQVHGDVSEKGCKAIGLKLKNEFAFAISHTLAGKTWILGIDWPVDPPKKIIFTSSGLVLATRQLDKQVSFQASPGLSTLWETWPI